MRVVVLQPGYLPWLGFFEQLHSCDRFVLYDDVQYTVRDWRSRNRIRTAEGWTWLTVPVRHPDTPEGLRGQRILEVAIDNDSGWAERHWRSIQTHYGKAPHFKAHEEGFREVYARRFDLLVELDVALTRRIAEGLGIDPSKLVRSSELGLPPVADPSGRLAAICGRLGADAYYSGAAAKGYLDVGLFEREGIRVEWQDYESPDYHQRHMRKSGIFVSHLSAIDLLFNHGPESLGILTGAVKVALPEGVRRVAPE